MIGIYKIENKINKKVYIGCSTNIENRWKSHLDRYKRESDNEYSKILYCAFRKYGIDNFTFEIIEEHETVDKNYLEQRETYYIALYNSYNDGYNATTGGSLNNLDQQGEKHHNAKLIEQDVIDIRTRYNNKERKQEVFILYQDKINHTGFHKIWNFATWKHIMPEVYTDENKRFHLHNTANSGSSNGKAKLAEQDVYNIRIRKKNGEDRKIVYLDYQNILTFKSFENVWYGINWKKIVV